MRNIVLVLLLWSGLVTAQIGNFPALVGQRGTTLPTNCTIGQLFFDTDATAGVNVYGCTAANTWTVQGGTGTVTGTGASPQVAYWSGASALTGSANLTFNGTTATFANGTSAAIVTGAGLVGTPAVTVGSATNNGIYSAGTNNVTIAAGAAPMWAVGGGAFSPGSAGYAAGSGAWNSGNGFIIHSYSATSGITDRASDPLLLYSGPGTGAGARGSVALFAAPTLGSGTTVQTPEELVRARIITTAQPILSWGGVTSSFPALRRVTTDLQVRLADDSAYTNIDALGLKRGGVVTVSGTAPTIASGGCTSPTVTNSNGTARVQIDVGTSCSGSQPVVFTFPAGTTGWGCKARNITNGTTSNPVQTGAVSTNSVTITNLATTTGLATAWTDGDDVELFCLGG